MQKTIFQVDAFTSEIFKGNPAGVMLLQESLDESLMQNIAAEMNLSETAFVNISSEPYEIRFFTPTVEIPLCGHATLASAHIIYEGGIKDTSETIQFKAEGGNLTISNTEGEIKMVFPKYKIDPVNIDTSVIPILGFEPIDMYRMTNDWIIVQAKDQSSIQNFEPNYTKLIENNLGHLIITAISNEPEIDYVVRCFAPASGIDEDPVTGSIQCGLVPFWNLKTGNTTFTAKQLSKRTGTLKLSLTSETVEISGKAVTVFEATLQK